MFIKQIFWSVNCKYFLIHLIKHMLIVLKRTVSLRRSFEYPQHMFWLRNKKSIFICNALKRRLTEGLQFRGYIQSYFQSLSRTFYVSACRKNNISLSDEQCAGTQITLHLKEQSDLGRDMLFFIEASKLFWQTTKADDFCCDWHFWGLKP